MFAFAAVAGLCSSANAQTPAPQLLPYTVKLIAGGGTQTIASGATCPVSGYTSTDDYGDGCLATEIQLKTAGAKIYYGEFPGFAIADSTGAVFFSDGLNGLVRRIDPVTGIVTAVVGGASASPTSGTACGAYASTDANGDGCLSTAVKLKNPAALAFDASGNLFVADVGLANIRKIAATGGVISAAGGVISNVAGGSTYGYKVNNTAGSPVIAATQSYLDEPFGLAFDAAGNLYVSDDGENAILVINLTGANETLQGVSIPAGTIQKIMGWNSMVDCPSFTSTSSRGGCHYGLWKEGALANTSPTDSPYQLAVVPGTGNAPNAGYIYFANEFDDNIGQISPSNIITSYAGIQSTPSTKPMRGVAGTFSMGSPFGVAADVYGNIYATDASSGLIWRVDQASKSMYVVAGGATTVCTGASDANGDGCPATQAKFGSSAGSEGYAGSTPPAPGIFGISVDTYGNLFVGDTETNLIREVSTGTQFGVVGANQPTQTVNIHFASGDSPSTATYSLTAGASNFSLGTVACNPANSDGTTDCLLPITATPTVLGAFTGTLQVVSTVSGTVSFPLSGTYAQSPITRTSVSYVATGVTCTGTSTYSTTTPIVTTAKIVANGPNPPSGTITFYANGAQIGTQSVTNLGTTAIPVYGATLSYTFATVGTYNITATYGGDSYFKPSTSAAATVTTSNPTFAASTISYQQNTVVAGQTGLYSFNLIQNVYNGTITLACSGLPANSSCSFSPTTVTAAGCSTTSTVALSINTQQGTKNGVATSSLGGPGRGPWAALGMIPGLLMALFIGLRRRRVPMRYGQLWMALALLLATSGTIACNGNVQTVPATPSGSYNITVTATGSAGTVASFTVPFTVK